MHAIQERKENAANMRKNRAYQELKREMDQKRRAREKVSKGASIRYVGKNKGGR